MKEFIDFLKKLWENKKTRSLVILLLYLVFFIFVFMIIGNNSQQLVVENDPLELLKSKKVYSIEIIGEYNFIFENDTIIYNDITYNINNYPDELANYDLTIFTPLNIYNLLKSSVLESTNYVEKSNTYLIKSKEFDKIIYGLSIQDDYDIRIISFDDNYNQIIIDLEDYYGYKAKIDLRS